ncbi:MAG: Arm DNA-binding domain-containing protein [Henriciella sp.]
MSGAKRHLTDALARKAKPKCREYALADVALQGFALRVQPSGSKAWILRMRVEGKLRRFTIGSPNTMNADEARTRAFQLRTEHQPKTVIQLACADEPAITFRELSHCLLQASVDGGPLARDFSWSSAGWPLAGICSAYSSGIQTPLAIMRSAR